MLRLWGRRRKRQWQTQNDQELTNMADAVQGKLERRQIQEPDAKDGDFLWLLGTR